MSYQQPLDKSVGGTRRRSVTKNADSIHTFGQLRSDMESASAVNLANSQAFDITKNSELQKEIDRTIDRGKVNLTDVKQEDIGDPRATIENNPDVKKLVEGMKQIDIGAARVLGLFSQINLDLHTMQDLVNEAND